MTLRLMKEQGVFAGDLTPLQRYSLHLASTFERVDKLRSDFQLVKALQMFTNPELYRHAYGAEEYEEEQEAIDKGFADEIMSFEDYKAVAGISNEIATEETFLKFKSDMQEIENMKLEIAKEEILQGL